MPSKFVFVGSKAEILGPPSYAFTAFGQTVDLDSTVANALILHQNFPLLPADEFAATESAPDHPHAARLALHDYRKALREKAAAAEAESAPEPAEKQQQETTSEEPSNGSI